MPTGYLLVVHRGDTYTTFHAPTELEAIAAGAKALPAARPIAMTLATKPLAAIVEHDGHRFRVLAADYTEDGHPITPGARLFNYYDGQWFTIDPAPFMSESAAAPGGQFFDGWYPATRELDGWLCKLNGQRLAKEEPQP